MTPIKAPPCSICKHYNRLNNDFPACRAFNIIPAKIWQEGNNHSTPLEGQGNSVVFEPINEQQSTNFNN